MEKTALSDAEQKADEIASRVPIVPGDETGIERVAVVAAFIRAGQDNDRTDYDELSSNALEKFGLPDPYEREACCGSVNGWVLGALKHMAAVTDEAAEPFKNPLKAILGNREYYRWLDNNEIFAEIKEICEGKLKLIGEDGEANIYQAQNLDALLGSLGEEFLDKKVRMDNEHILGKIFTDLFAYDEWKFIVALMILTAAIDQDFQEEVREIAEEAGGQLKTAPPKGYNRMWNKLWSDHKDEHVPRPAANIDLSRNGITFNNVEDCIKCFELIVARFPPLRAKNNLRAIFEALESTFGYRALLMNMKFVPRDKNLTWGELLRSAKFRAAYIELIKQHAEDVGESEKVGKKWFDLVLQKLLDSEEFCGRKVRFVVESQFIMEDYLSMRKQSHLWYKIFRADDQRALWRDFSKYGLTRQEGFRRKWF